MLGRSVVHKKSKHEKGYVVVILITFPSVQNKKKEQQSVQTKKTGTTVHLNQLVETIRCKTNCIIYSKCLTFRTLVKNTS